MSSKSSHKHRHEHSRHRSRSRSPHDRGHRKERSHRTDKHHDRHDHERAEREEMFPKKIKEEPADKGYRKYENPGDAGRTGSHDCDGRVERSRSEVVRTNVKEEPADKGYRRHEYPRGAVAVERSRNRDARDVTHADDQGQVRQERERNDERRREHRRQRGDENPFHQSAGNARQGGPGGGGNQEGPDANAPPPPKEGPNFGLSGALTEDTNTFRGIVIKYNEPPEARKPKLRWRLYVFKGDQEMPTLYIHRQSAYLLGRERLIADIPIDHPSCSKQHAAIQYRLVEYEKDDGTTGKRVRPYVIDLESANGTFLNNKRVDPKRYYELQEKDVLKFGFSSREYVVLHEKTSTAELDDGDF